MSPVSLPLITPNASSHDGDFVNHDISVTLDSTNAFEGPEKLLEIWFASSSNNLPIDCNYEDGLRSIPYNEIEAMLDLVNCKILSKISSEKMDSYLLSESSLFVFPHKLILKTCGTTTTLLCLEKLFALACDYLNWNLNDSIYRIFYSRRSFMFPERQVELHQSWDNEVRYLNKFFNKTTSKAYVVGDLSKDHWYLYINGTDEIKQIERPLSPPSSLSSHIPEDAVDETFELLMTDLSPAETPNFVSSSYHNLHDEFPSMDPRTDDYGHLLGLKTMNKTRLNKVFNYDDGADKINAKHDAFAFDPCGFSSNSIVDDKFYYTLHVTPEHGWSYASFETNLPSKISKLEVIDKILNVFKPGQFCLVYMKELDDLSSDSEFSQLFDCKIKGYSKIDKICYDLKFNYKCLYSYFEKI